MSEYTLPFVIIWIAVTVIIPFSLRKRGIQEGQMLATGLGILGTFVGIVIGLLNFDVSNISQSVPQLLDGLRFAFFTSIAGMTISLFIGIFPRQLGFASAQGDESKSEAILLAEMAEELRTLNKNIAGENDPTLITQIQKLRTSVNDKQDELKKAFDEFATEMAENNMKALIDAVSKVMEDFNAKINDQLGENFKRLSEGVEGLVTWQDQYKQQIIDSTTALQESGKGIVASMESLREISAHAQSFSEVAQELQKSLEAMGASITGIKSLAESLQDNGKQIRDEMEEITKQSLQSLGQKLASISEKLVEDYGHVQRAISNIANKS